MGQLLYNHKARIKNKAKIGTKRTILSIKPKVKIQKRAWKIRAGKLLLLTKTFWEIHISLLFAKFAKIRFYWGLQYGQELIIISLTIIIALKTWLKAVLNIFANLLDLELLKL